jgi:hypothetical protein
VDKKMVSKQVDYSNTKFSPERLPVVIDFTKSDVINDPENRQKKNTKDLAAMREEIRGELIEYTKVSENAKTYRDAFEGGYISTEDLKLILKKDRRDRSYYRLIDNIRKTTPEEAAINKDFDLLRDFFPNNIVTRVQNYCYKIIPKVEEILLEKKKITSFTPRKRRGIILAVFRQFIRKNGRQFTDELLDEINERFGYQRTIKMFEVCRWQNRLVQMQFLKRTPKAGKNKLQLFYLNLVKQVNNLREQPEIAQNKDYLAIIQKARKHIMDFTKKPEAKEALLEICLHKEADFAARIIFWTLCKHIAETEYNLTFTRVEELAGWKTIFIADITSPNDSEEQLPIRTWKYIFWAEFNMRNELKELGIFYKQ